MAQLGDLPPELILTIFSHLRLGLPIHDLFVWPGDIDEQGQITGVRWNDLLNFSLLNRHFRRIVSDKLYTQIRIHGKLPIPRLVSPLRFVTAHPHAAADVRQVYINLGPWRTGSAFLQLADVDFIQTAAAKVGITYPQEIFHCDDRLAGASEEREIGLGIGGFLELEHLRLQVLVNISLAHLKGTQELALTCAYGIFRNFGLNDLAKLPGLIDVGEADDSASTADKRPMLVSKPCLPQLLSLVTTRIIPNRLIGFDGDEIANLLCIGPKITRLCLAEAGLDFKIQKSENWTNISHLTLTTQHIGTIASTAPHLIPFNQFN